MEQKAKAAASRRKILDAAVLEFSHVRFEKASVNQICRDGQITKGKLYYYFESKDAIYLAAIRYCLDRLKKDLLAVLPDPSLPMEDNILQFFAAWQHFWKENIPTTFFMGRAKLAPPDHLRGEVAKMMRQFRDTVLLTKLKDIFRIYFPGDENRQKLFALISNVAMSYISIYTGLPQLAAATDEAAFFERQTALFKTLVHIFLHGCMNTDVPPLQDDWPESFDAEP